MVFCKLTKLQLKLYEFFLNSKPVKALLASTMGEDGAPRKRKPSKAAASQAAGDGQEDQPPEQEEQQLLAPLAAITALKKLCCHPDLVWQMINKHKVEEAKAQQAAQLALMREAQKRVSARAATQVNCGGAVNGLQHLSFLPADWQGAGMWQLLMAAVVRMRGTPLPLQSRCLARAPCSAWWQPTNAMCDVLLPGAQEL